MKRCPYCQEEIHDEAIKCKHCKRMIGAPAAAVSPEQTKSNLGVYKNVQSGIGGWLFLPALAIIIQPIVFIQKNLEVFRMAQNFGGRVIIDYPAMITNLIILFCVALVGYLFFKRKTIAPVSFVLYILIGFSLWTIHDTFAAQFKAPIIANLFTSFVLIPYFVYSKRVKITFTNELDNTIWIDRLFEYLTPFLNTFDAFLGKTRKFLLLEIFLFVVISFVLSSFFRAVFVLKDISAFRQLLF